MNIWTYRPICPAWSSLSLGPQSRSHGGREGSEDAVRLGTRVVWGRAPPSRQRYPRVQGRGGGGTHVFLGKGLFCF